MTYQEAIWKNKIVWVVSIMTKTNRAHRYLLKYVGRCGQVLGEAKNGMLLIQFAHGKKRELRSIPSSCISEYMKTLVVRR